MVRLRQFILVEMILLLFQGNIYCQNSMRSDHLIHSKEILFLTTDRKIYLSGDEIWLSIKCVNAFSHKVSVPSKVAYVELYDNNKSAVVKRMIRLSNGKGFDVIQIPPSLETGYYTLRAYTNWMKNFSKSHYTNCIIPIVNPLIKSLDYAGNSLDFRFYPESGNLVQGIPNRICYSVVSKREIKSCSVLDNEDNIVTSFSMNNIDIGSFTFIPENKDYKIIIKDNRNSTYNYSLPAVRNDLSHISIYQGSSFLEINVRRPDPATARFMEIQKFDSVYLRLELNNSEQNQIIKIDNTQIPYGISMVYLKNLDGSIQCARPILNMGNNSDGLSCETDKAQYNTREKVELTIKTNAVNAIASIAIKKDPKASGLRKIELLPLIFSKRPYINSWYASSIDIRTWEDYMILNTDSLISVHNCDRRISISNPPEYTGHIINVLASLPKEGSEEVHELFLTLKGDPYGFYTSTISKDKSFYFPIQDPPIKNDLIFSYPYADISKIIEIKINDPFDKSTPGDSLPSLFITNELLSYLEQTSLDNQLKFAFSINDKIEYRDSVSLLSMKNLPHAKTIYLLDDYTRFPVMEEVFREIIKIVYVRKNSGNYFLKILDTENSVYLDQNPLILLDGLPIFDVNKLMEINPLFIESIEILNLRSYIGECVFDGVIYVNSYKRDYADYAIDHNYNEMNYYHIDDSISYITPDYSNQDLKKSRIPDFRNLLYWNPDITIDQDIPEKIEFYTSDDEGIYEIEISGINKDGSIISKKSDFKVIKSN